MVQFQGLNSLGTANKALASCPGALSAYVSKPNKKDWFPEAISLLAVVCWQRESSLNLKR